MLDVAAWENFAVMIGGASGALTGPLFISVSVNRDKIVHSSALRVVTGVLNAWLFLVEDVD